MSLVYSYAFTSESDFSPDTAPIGTAALVGLEDGGFVVLGNTGSISLGDIRTGDGGNGPNSPGMAGIRPAGVQLTDGRILVATQDADSILYRTILATGFLATSPVDIGDTGASGAAVTALQDGGFAIAYQDLVGADHNITLRLYGADGLQTFVLSPSALVGVDERDVAMTTLDNGNIALVWEREVSGNTQIWRALYSPTGDLLAAPDLVDSFGTINANPQVVATSYGFAIVYEDNGWAGSTGTEITMARHDMDSGFIAYTNLTNSPTFSQGNVEVTRLAGGFLAMTYEDATFADGDVHLRVLREDGSFVSPISFIDGVTLLGGNQVRPDLAPAGQSGIAVAFDGPVIEGERNDIRVTVTSDGAVDIAAASALFETFVGANADGVSYLAATTAVQVNLDTGIGTGGDAAGDRYEGIGLVIGSQAGDVITGNAQSNFLNGAGGADRLDGGAGADLMEGGLGNDTYIVDALGDLVRAEAGFGAGGGIDTVITSVDFTAPANVEILRALVGVAGIDLTGNDAPGTLVGNAGANRLEGRGGNDQINGNAGTDTLTGGEGADTLVGGLGADTFVYQAVSNSRAGIASRDVLNGFDRGAVQDRIDLSAIDANTATALNDAFAFIGTAAFTAAGQVRIQSLGGPNAVIVEVNVNGGLAADMQIFVNLTTTMAVGDFVL
jgi:Ca2+-binding RTX toxin-like protein